MLTGDSALMSPAASFTYTVPIAIFIGVVLLGLVHAVRRGLLRWT